LDALGRGIPLRIVPLGIHYESAWEFRSKAEVVVGDPIATEFPIELSQQARLKEIKRRITAALESVGANFSSTEAQAEAERIACAAALRTHGSYFAALKSMETGVPESLLSDWRELAAQLAARRVLLHQGVPLFPLGPWMLDMALLLALGPIVLAGALVNAPPLLLGWLAARKLAADRNVIALWRILVGLPLFLFWFGAMNISLAFFVGWAWALAYSLLTGATLKSLHRAKKLGVAVWNGIARRDLAPRAHEFYHAALQSLAH
jgi:hypothetical protein